MNKTIMHINYGELTYNSYGKRTIDDICRMAANIGYDGIEFRGEPPQELENLSFGEYAARIAEGKKKYGLSEIVFGIGVGACCSDDKAVREKSIADAIEKAKIANELCGTTVCNTFGSTFRSAIATAPGTAYEFHGSAAATEKDWELTVDAYQQIGKELEKIGVKFAFETHMFYIHDLPKPTRKLIDLIDSPAIGINMDYGNTAYFSIKPSVEEAIEIYGNKIFYAHLKNSSVISGTSFCIDTSLCDGEINHRAYLERLIGNGFAGPIAIEAPRDGDREWFAKQDFEYFKSVINSI